MSENKYTEVVTKGASISEESSSSPSSPRRIGRSNSTASTSSQRSYSQRFSLTASQPYLVPDERLLQLKDRKLLMDVMYDDLLNVSWLLGITPRSTPVVDKASYYSRTCVCCPCYVLSRGFTLMTCFISDSCPGMIKMHCCLHEILLYKSSSCCYIMICLLFFGLSSIYRCCISLHA